MIPYVDLPAQHQPLRAELLEAVGRVLDHGMFILGPEVAELEARLAARLGVPHVVTLNSGTDALMLALKLRGVGPGDEVITVSHSFVATAQAVRLVGATPVLVDVDPTSMLMDPAAVEAAITPATRAVIPVHLGGFACDMTAIAALCAARGLTLIEDCAQSIGAKHAGQPVGTFGVGCFSLHPLKVLSACGDGGFAVVESAEDAEMLRRLRNNGLRDRDHVAEIAANSRLDTIQAAMLLVKERHLDQWVEARRAHAAGYREALAGHIQLPPEEGPGDFSVYSTFVVRHPRRDAFLAALEARGVSAKVHYPVPIHRQQPYARPDLVLPHTDRVVSEIVSLPVVPEISAGGRREVINAVIEAVEEVG